MIRVFSQLGVRMMHLTYNRRNLLADGCAEASNGGLSDFGMAAIKEMNRQGILIDVAHTGWQASKEAAQASSSPIVASHSAAWDLHAHARSKPDAVIKAIVDGGGTIGVTTIPAFLGGDGTLLSMLAHIDYLVKKFGEDAVTIGTDSPYISEQATAARQRLRPFPARPRWENFWGPGQDPYQYPEWNHPEQHQSMAWTNWPLFTVGLVQKGYSDAAVQKIIGGNLLRVAEQAWQLSTAQGITSSSKS